MKRIVWQKLLVACLKKELKKDSSIFVWRTGGGGEQFTRYRLMSSFAFINRSACADTRRPMLPA